MPVDGASYLVGRTDERYYKKGNRVLTLSMPVDRPLVSVHFFTGYDVRSDRDELGGCGWPFFAGERKLTRRKTLP